MTLRERVTTIAVRWHQRAVMRRWPGAKSGPFEITVSGGPPDADREGSNSALALDLDLTPEDGSHRIGMRGTVMIDDAHLLAVLDVEIRAEVEGDEPPTDDDLIDFTHQWGHDYMMGYLRAGLTDLAAEVGVPNVVLPPSYTTQPSPEVAQLMVADARARAAGDADPVRE